jgi:hypothetical protein
VSDSIMRPVHTFADRLSSLLGPTSWDISIATAVDRLADWIGSDSLLSHLTPIAPMLAGTPSGTALDIAYGTSDAPHDLESACAALTAEIEFERDWLLDNAPTWAVDDAEAEQVGLEFARLLDAICRLPHVAR